MGGIVVKVPAILLTMRIGRGNFNIGRKRPSRFTKAPGRFARHNWFGFYPRTVRARIPTGALDAKR